MLFFTSRILGVQWELLPVNTLFEDKELSRQSVYYHYRKWNLNKDFKHCRINILKKYKSKLDLSSVDFDGSHTPIREGEQMEYQARKKRKTTNVYYLMDRQVISLAISEPVAGNHNDLYNIEFQLEETTSILEEADISVEGLFMNGRCKL